MPWWLSRLLILPILQPTPHSLADAKLWKDKESARFKEQLKLSSARVSTEPALARSLALTISYFPIQGRAKEIYGPLAALACALDDVGETETFPIYLLWGSVVSSSCSLLLSQPSLLSHSPLCAAQDTVCHNKCAVRREQRESDNPHPNLLIARESETHRDRVRTRPSLLSPQRAWNRSLSERPSGRVISSIGLTGNTTLHSRARSKLATCWRNSGTERDDHSQSISFRKTTIPSIRGRGLRHLLLWRLGWRLLHHGLESDL